MLEGSLEDNVLCVLCWNATHAPTVAFQVTADLFSTRAYKQIAEKALDYFHTYAKPPGVHLNDLLERELRRGNDEGKLLRGILEDMEALNENLQPDFVVKELDTFIKTQRLGSAIQNAADALARDGVEAAERALAERDVVKIDEEGLWLHDGEAMTASFMDVTEDEFTSGIEELDRRHVRPARGTVMLLIGAKKIGKSFWLVQIGRQTIMQRKKVLHISLENSKSLTAKRYIQALFAMTARPGSETIRVPKFMKDQLGHAAGIEWDERRTEMIGPDTRSRIVSDLNQYVSRGHLKIKEFPMGSLTIAQLTSYLDMLERVDNFVPDLILLDSVNKMSVRAEHLRLDLGRNLTLLRGIAQARNMAIVTPTHSNRGGDMARTVSGAKHIGEDYSMLGTADTVCTISRTPSEKERGLARILVDAARDSEDSYVVMITQNYATAQFCLDSVYMNKHLEQEVGRISGDEEEENDDG